MSNCILSYPDQTISATLSGGSWTAGMPLANLKSTDLATKARTADDAEASTIIKADLGSAKAVVLISLINHNLSDAATVKITGSNASDYSAPVYAGDVITVPPAISGYPKYYTATVTGTARYWKVEISDTSNPDGYVELSRCFVGLATFQPDLNMSFGAGIAPISDTIIDKSIGGVQYFDVRSIYRSWSFALEHMAEASGNTALDLQMQLGLDKEMFFQLDPEDTAPNMQRRAFLCTLSKLSPLRFAYLSRYAAAFELVEKL